MNLMYLLLRLPSAPESFLVCVTWCYDLVCVIELKNVD